MSQPTIQTAPCPGCGKEMEFKLWQTINTDVENAREDIISGELFRYDLLFSLVNFPFFYIFCLLHH